MALQDRRAERRFFELLDAQDLSACDLGPDRDQILEDELERVRLEGACTQLVYVQRVRSDFGPDGLPIAWTDGDRGTGARRPRMTRRHFALHGERIICASRAIATIRPTSTLQPR